MPEKVIPKLADQAVKNKGQIDETVEAPDFQEIMRVKRERYQQRMEAARKDG